MHFPILDDLERPLYIMRRLKSAKGAYGALPDLLAGEERLATPSPKHPLDLSLRPRIYALQFLGVQHPPTPLQKKNSWLRRWYTGKVTGIPVPAGTGTGTGARVRVGYG